VKDDSEPLLSVTAQGIDVQPRRTGRKSIDLVIATCAIFMSILSLMIAYNQARMMRQQVAATSWPLLQFVSGNTDEQTGKLTIVMEVRNAGVGPAIVKHFSIYYRNREYTNGFDLLVDCCQYRLKTLDPSVRQPGAPLTSPVEGTIIRAGESTTFFQIPLVPQNQSSWRLLDEARFKLKFDACYCSVLGECWSSDLAGVDPKPVKSCPSPRARRSG